ncbi:MAG: GTPase HflX [Alphaproteobacteria bacterium]|nr:GTPase HflX [Alphaproteobacteria bacterium]
MLRPTEPVAGGSDASSGRALVVHPFLKRRAGALPARAPEARLEEAVGLAAAIRLEIAASALAPLAAPRPATLIGQGKVAELKALVAERAIELTVVDGTLTPVQQRNLEKELACKVLDRTGLILEIFGARARTREGRLQVELARLDYQKGRLVRSWTHLERQRGGSGKLGGPGETQLESDRRALGERILRLKKQLAEVQRTRALHRAERRKAPHPVVALVGYTNAGKSTLFNRLTGGRVFAADLLFATLDPTMRGLDLPSGRRIILSDTVGFISDLPHELVAAFRATLEEVLEAALIVHVRDVSHPDSAAQDEDVHRVLGEIGIGDRAAERMLVAANKIDRLDAAAREDWRRRAERDPAVVPVSALGGDGMAELLAAIDARLGGARRLVEVTLAAADGATLAWLYRHGEVVARDSVEGGRIALKVGLDPADLGRLEKRLGAGALGAR